MKKLLSAIVAGSMLLSMAGCGAPAAPAPSAGGSASTAPVAPAEPAGSDTSVKKIGIIQFTEHPALDDAYKGFIEGLAAAGFEDGKNITIEFQSAQNEPANCVTIADKMINDKCDLILAIATPAAQALANKTTEIPILITAVTDPATAKLVATNEAPGGNITGTSDLNPIKEQMDLLKQLVPEVKKVAMLYCSSEANSEFQVELAKEQLATMGIETMDATVTSTGEIQQVIQSLKGKVDAIYAPTDNMVSGAMPIVSATAHELGIPVIVAEPAMVERGGLATYGLSYLNLGKQTAEMAVRILKDGAKPGEMPIEYLKDVELVINETAASTLGITIPVELLNKARIVK